MVAVPVKGKVLEWARKTRRFDLPEAAKATGLPLSKIQAFESGDALPTLGELEKMASGYAIAFAALLMPEPLPDTTRPKIVDFRVREGDEPPPWSHELSVAADVVNEQLAGLADLLAADAELAMPIDLPQITIRDNVEAKAAEERERIGVTVEQQMALETPAKAFQFWRYTLEQRGVLVYLMDLGKWQDCRGYSVFDYPAVPAVVINNDEKTPGARLYTLLHEYCHLLLRQAGLSDQNRRNAVEAYCNSFAAHFLMPRAAFAVAARSAQKERSPYWTDGQLKKLGDIFGVSMSATALHLEQLMLVPPGLYDRKVGEWRKYSKANKAGGMPMPYADRQIGRLGMRHIGLVMDAVRRGSLNQIEAYDLTEVQPKHYDDLRAALKQRQETYGT
jgi:Zn-dependent peptidase ImmA (M78 family)